MNKDIIKECLNSIESIDHNSCIITKMVDKILLELSEDIWIKCSTDLPKIDEYVLWLYENGSIFEDSIDKDWDSEYLKHFLSGDTHTGPVTHWMYKPQYPEDK